VQGLTFVLCQIVPLIVDDQVELSAFGQPSWLIEVQPPVPDTCTQRSHVTTVWRKARYRQAGGRADQNNAQGVVR
jgi:hypothetical protein